MMADAYTAAIRQDGDWWIGSHDEYEKIIKKR
jgi:hypothetical protein